jgi:putative redox protein
MVRISVEYQGELHCQARHDPSQTALPTDAPVDNQGRGESFSPTDLVATALGTCMLTTMAIAARREGVAMDGSTATVDKEMTSAGPRRIQRLTVRVKMSIPRSADPGSLLEQVGRGCPVARSLGPEVEQAIEFEWSPET